MVLNRDWVYYINDVGEVSKHTCTWMPSSVDNNPVSTSTNCDKTTNSDAKHISGLGVRLPNQQTTDNPQPPLLLSLNFRSSHEDVILPQAKLDVNKK